MRLTLLGRLDPSSEDHQRLLRTMRTFNAACNVVAGIAFERGTASKFALQRLVYADVRSRFGLSAQLTIRCIGKVCDAYKVDKTKRVSCRDLGAVPYDERILSFKGLDRASITTLDGRAIVPVRWGAYGEARFDRIRGQTDLILRKGVFYLAALVDAPEATKFEPTGVLGVDLGRRYIAVDSDGVKRTGAGIRRVRDKHHALRRILQAVNTRSATRHLRKLSGREANFARNTNHVISKALVKTAQDTKRALALENLEGIRTRTTVQRSERRYHTGWAFDQLRGFVEYKAALGGVTVLIVDPAYTSQDCYACGHRDRANRNGEDFACLSCGHVDHADVNAAHNIAARAAVNLPIVSRIISPEQGHLVPPQMQATD